MVQGLHPLGILGHCHGLREMAARPQLWVCALQVMADVAHEAESLAQNEAIWRYMKDSTPRPVTSTEAMASSAVALSFDDEFGMIVVISETGDTERFVAKYRPRSGVAILCSGLCSWLPSIVAHGRGCGHRAPPVGPVYHN